MDDLIGKSTERLKSKLEKLIHLHTSLKEDNHVLRLENASLKQQLSEVSENNQQLLQKQVLLKLSNEIGRDDEKKTEVKRKINDLIREIDRCITLLTN